jgi:cellulose biosynthesis protein BcsS
MLKVRLRTIWAAAALWAASLWLAAMLTAQPGLAQQASDKSDAGPGAADLNPMFLGARDRKVVQDPGALSTVWYSGYDVARGSQYVFTGASYALNGDLSRNGFYLRAYGSRVDFDLDPGDGRGYQLDVMLGYRVTLGKVFGGVYIGADYQNFRLDPDDPFAEVRGTEWGFKVAADVATLRNGLPYYLGLEGNYSTAFQTYWARARTGLTLHGVTFGPEGIALGDVGFDAQRVGGFIIFDVPLWSRSTPLEVSLHVGHQFVAGSGSNNGTEGSVAGGEGTYGGITLVLVF